MLSHPYSTLFGNDSVDKQLLISTADGSVNITNTELHNGAFELKERISPVGKIVFGYCEAATLKFTVSNVFTDLKNQWLTVTTTLNKDTANSFQIGRYKVYSDVPTADRKKRNVVAYDALYDVLQADVSAWYNSILPKESSTTTLKAFRNSFFTHFGIEQEEVTLVNDNMVVAKTIQPEELSGKTVINAICEINGCFGNIGRNGKFRYVYLEKPTEALYPSHDLYPSEDLYPIKPTGTTLTTGLYIPPATYETYVTQNITGLVIRQEEDDIGGQVGSLDNAYVIQDNFLVYGKSNSELQTIGNNILGKIKHISYRPFNTKAKGNFCVEVGDYIRLSTKNQRVESYVLQRTITGIQALRDDYTAEGEELLPKSVNSTSRQVQRLNGKYNKLTMTVDETRLEMGDIEKDLKATVSVMAKEISLKVESSEVESMISIALDEITISSDQINLEGYTTINGYFKITNDGKVILKGDSGYTCQMAEQSFNVSNSNNDSSTSYRSDGILCTYNNSVYRFSRVTSAGIYLGLGNSPIIDIYTRYINGNTPITSGNINNYVDPSEILSSATTYDIEADVNSSGNIRFNGKTAVSTTYLSSELSDLESKIDKNIDYISDILGEIGQLKARVSALEAAI